MSRSRRRVCASNSVATGQHYGCHTETELRVIEVQVGGSIIDEYVEWFGHFWGVGVMSWLMLS